MRHINYNHLFYFWNVADAGSIAAASKRLYLTPQTISTQIKLLEEASGTPLFQKSGRRLVLTEQGVVVKDFADEIFSLGLELSQYMRGSEQLSANDLTVGIVETLPKIAVEQLLEPAFDSNVRLICLEGDLATLIDALHKHELDLIVSDQSIPVDDSSRIYIHALGQSKLALFAPPLMMEKYSHDFPNELNDAPILLPTENSPLRRAGEDWFIQHGITPSIVAECSDSGLIKAIASAGRGMFIAPINIQTEIEKATGCKLVGELDDFTERYYAITLDKKIKHPLVSEIADSARTSLALD